MRARWILAIAAVPTIITCGARLMDQVEPQVVIGSMLFAFGLGLGVGLLAYVVGNT